jgi:hypothetical protein
VDGPPAASGWPGTDKPAEDVSAGDGEAPQPTENPYPHEGSDLAPVGSRGDSDVVSANWAGPAYSAGTGEGFYYGSGSGT